MRSFMRLRNVVKSSTRLTRSPLGFGFDGDASGFRRVEQLLQASVAIGGDEVVIAADVRAVDEDLRHGAAALAPFEHLAELRGIAVDAELVPLETAILEEVLCGDAVGADRRAVDFDSWHRGHPLLVARV